jgi:hypothetical protein
VCVLQDDVESIVAQIEMEEKRKQAVVEVAADRPLKRSSFAFVPHPEKDELILFGGEFFNGQKVKFCLFHFIFLKYTAFLIFMYCPLYVFRPWCTMISWATISARERGYALRSLVDLHLEVVIKWLLFQEARVVSYGSLVVNLPAQVNHNFTTTTIFGCITSGKRSGRKSSEYIYNMFINGTNYYFIKAALGDPQLEVATEWFCTSGSWFCLEAITTILLTSNISTTFTRLTSRTTNGKNLNLQVNFYLSLLFFGFDGVDTAPDIYLKCLKSWFINSKTKFQALPLLQDLLAPWQRYPVERF